MTRAALTERTVSVDGKDILVAETGHGPAVLLLHGGGPAPPVWRTTRATSTRSPNISG